MYMEHTYRLSTAEERESFFIGLYKKVFPAVAQYVAKRGGTADDAKDIFQDAVISYYEKLVSPGFSCVNEQAYLMGICKHLWSRKFNNDAALPLDENVDLEDAAEEQPVTERLLHYLETAGQKCMNLLRAFYYDQLPLRDIAGLFGYSGERSATVQKYKCLEKVRDTVKQKALHYEDFVE